MRFLGIDLFWGDILAMACFAVGAFFFGAPPWLTPIIGIATWRLLAK